MARAKCSEAKYRAKTAEFPRVWLGAPASRRRQRHLVRAALTGNLSGFPETSRRPNFSRFQDFSDIFYNDHIALAKSANVAWHDQPPTTKALLRCSAAAVAGRPGGMARSPIRARRDGGANRRIGRRQQIGDCELVVAERIRAQGGRLMAPGLTGRSRWYWTARSRRAMTTTLPRKRGRIGSGKDHYRNQCAYVPGHTSDDFRCTPDSCRLAAPPKSAGLGQ